MSTEPNPAEGGRRGWKGVRFEAAFASLNLISTIVGRRPIGLDEHTDARASQAIEIRFQPQADGAVDDLVALSEERRIVAYQLKSGLATLPRVSSSKSDTAEALRQAGLEIRNKDGAAVVVLVFGRLQPPVRELAKWLSESGGSSPTQASLSTLESLLGFAEGGADWESTKPRLRILEKGSATEVAAEIDAILELTYSSPSDRLLAADAMSFLVGVHSDVDGARLDAIDRQRLVDWFGERHLPPLQHLQPNDPQVSQLALARERFLQGLRVGRGSLPEIPRPTFVARVVDQLGDQDVVLLGGGGTGKSEIAGQVLREYVSQGWLPLPIRNVELLAGAAAAAEALGAGGRTAVVDLVCELARLTTYSGCLVVLDGLDEATRAEADTSAEVAAGLLQILQQVRLRCVSRDRLHILLTCRKSDWPRIAGAAKSTESFLPIDVPAVEKAEIDSVVRQGDELAEYLDSTDEFHRTLVLRRPLLLRMAFELWLQRREHLADGSEPSLTDISSEYQLWKRYFDEYVCAPSGFSADPATILRCHDAVVRNHVDGERFSLIQLAAQVELDHGVGLAWLKGLEVVVSQDAPLGARQIRLFHSSYADFALAQLLATDSSTRAKWSKLNSLAISLLPAWEIVARIWATLDREELESRVSEILRDPTADLVQSTMVREWSEFPSHEGIQRAVALELRSAPLLLAKFVELSTERFLALRSTGYPTWIDAFSSRWGDLDAVALDAAQRQVVRLFKASAEPPKDVAWSLALTGWKLAAARAEVEGTPHNAMILARNSSTLASFGFRKGWVADIPLRPDSWGVADAVTAGALSSEVCIELMSYEQLSRLFAEDLEGTIALMKTALVTVPQGLDAQVATKARHPFSGSLTMSLRQRWTAGLHELEQSVPALLAKDASVAQIVALAWQLFGMAKRGRSGEPQEPESGAEYWIPDMSASWWPGNTGYESMPHRAIAKIGLQKIGDLAASGHLECLDVLSRSAHECQWAGLGAIVCDIATAAIGCGTLGPSDELLAFRIATAVLEKPGAFLNEDLRAAATRFFPLVFSGKHPQLTTLVDGIRHVADPKRLALLPVPEPPDLEKIRQEFESKLVLIKDSIEQQKETGVDALSLSIELALVERFTPPERFEHAEERRREALQRKSEAERGAVPLEDEDVRWLVSALSRTKHTGHWGAVPADLQALWSRAVEEMGVEAFEPGPTTPEVTFGSRFLERPSPSQSTDARESFVLEIEELVQASKGRQVIWTEQETQNFKNKIENALNFVGVDERSPLERPKGSLDGLGWRAQQPFPKDALLDLIALYLTNLPEGGPHGLSDPVLSAILKLSRDTDPAHAASPEFALSESVRGRAAKVLTFLATCQGPQEVLVEIERLCRDPAPQVRWTALQVAPVLRSLNHPVFSRVRESAVSSEADPVLLSGVVVSMFRPWPKAHELEGWDKACAGYLQRCFVEQPSPWGGAVSKAQDGAMAIAPVAAWTAVHFDGSTRRVARRILTEHGREPHGPILLSSISRQLLEAIDEGVGDARVALDLLDGYARRARHVAEDLDSTSNPDALRAEHKAVVEVAASLVAMLMGFKPRHHFKLTYGPKPQEARADRLKNGHVLLNLPRLLATWRDLVTPWIARPELRAAAVSMLEDGLKLLIDVAPLDAVFAGRTLFGWQPESSPGLVAREVNVTITQIVRVLFEHGNSFSPEERRRMATILGALARGGLDEASELAAELALKARQA